VIVCDTGPLVAAAIKNDVRNGECVDLFTALHLAGRRILARLRRRRDWLPAQPRGRRWRGGTVLTSLADGTLWPVELTGEDYARAAELVIAYQSRPLGTTDATVIAVCERLGLTEVASLDRRHFTVVRPRHVKALTLLPD